LCSKWGHFNTIEKHDAREDRIHKDSQQQQKIEEERFEKIFSARNESEHNRSISDERQYKIQNSSRWATVAAAVFTFGAVVAATWYACVTHGRWKEMQTQSKTHITRVDRWFPWAFSNFPLG